MDKPIVTLSVQGIVSDPAEKANAILANYISSLYSQSTLYYGTIHSLKHDERTSGMDPTAMCSTVTQALKDLFKPYYTNADIKVRYEPITTGIHYRLFISGSLYDGKVRYDLAKSIDFNNGKFVNEGEVNE